MNDWSTLILLAFGLSMDAFAVSVCNGLSVKGLKKQQMVFLSLVFGLMQGIMPLLGYFLGGLFLRYIESYLKWISFALLVLIGGKMVFEGISGLRKKEEKAEKEFSVPAVLLQGVATSIDALAVGVSLLGFSVSIFLSAPVIAVITFAVCLLGVFLGKKFGNKMQGKNGIADLLGGAVLIALGISFLFR